MKVVSQLNSQFSGCKWMENVSMHEQKLSIENLVKLEQWKTECPAMLLFGHQN